jgi:hypothetical protein
MRCFSALLAIFAIVWSVAASAAEPIGQVKTAEGIVTVGRSGATAALKAGDRVYQSDVVATGADGSVGITFADNSMLSLGPSSELVLYRFAFNTTTHKGFFDARLRKGTLVGKSGQITKETPEAMVVRTPAVALLVKGTKFLVRAEGD